MLSPRLDWMLGCCSGSSCDSHGGQVELQVHLTSDRAGGARKHPLTRGDSFDITFTPRSFGDPSGHAAAGTSTSRTGPLTPRQQTLRSQLELPLLNTYPIPPNATADESEEERKKKLLILYQEFALDLHTGMYLTQLTSNRDYSDIHCQLMEDMVTLKLDQSNGRIIEFPLTNVSKVYRIVKNDDRWYTAGTSPPPNAHMNTEQIVVVEFMRRKLAFVFKELQVSQRFLICMELLIRRAQQKQALRSLTPTFPPQQTQGRQCPTPRQVHDAAMTGRPPPSAGK
mmetsp:Transcript_88136/g.184174  ORF Transcript_88136/g.184174 Transcript_88136/m.184174 type:complete len:283 (-) Transcript_88136:51-899(-)|eukprot:CAMPEP_0206444652 /NCGR_PEP_ID=MMETSP0324_2-20121206/15037_1 /ASSEMBLY_ACC=CAM_ASM_000836 /TAXON_ID=2866 /ORGANISM="Crypthecodinium cohnii, Strain Seligo" /LENGTH=282 /DNA_ID=CAMNT_0053912711 /DNA_START=386 /DNA_END=1234 /DNA_ORIENTATION=-